LNQTMQGYSLKDSGIFKLD